MFNKGDDVVVSYDDEEFVGEVIRDSGQWVLCRIQLDPTADLDGGERMGYPHSYVMVRRTQVSRG